MAGRVGRIKHRRRGDYWRPRRRSPFVHALRALLVILLTVLIVPPTAVGVAAVTYFLMPLPGSLPEERPQADSRRSIVVAADGSTIGEFRELETRVVVPSSQIPKVLRDAVIAVEDKDFYAHKGIDVRGVARALWADVRSGKLEQGGSTITQQLVKNLYTSGERTLSRKLREAILATQVERALTKDEIMARYLNTVYLGDSNFGVEAASQSYFRKPARELNLAEAALLAGVIPAPSRYSPRQHPAEAEEKRQVVLDQMLKQGLASRQDVIAAKVQHPTIHPHPKVKGLFPYFLDYVRIYLLDVKGYSPDLIYRGGLRIETSLEPSLQEHAEKVVSSTLDLPEDPEASLVAVEPRSGFVRALVGGRSWDESKVNLGLGKLGGGSGRQAGSAFKPFVLARAFDLGLPPTKRYSAPASIQPRGFTKPVGNYEGGGYGSADLRKATWSSINTVFVQLILDVGVKETAEMAKRLGITSIDLDKPIYGGIAIGTQEVSPLDMASAFSSFASRGMRADPTPVVRITDRSGKVIEDNTRDQARRVLEEAVADNVNDVLRGVIESGTARRADIGRPAAGKTGTSQEFQNAWFVGYTPTLSTAVWMGYPQANLPMRNIHGVPKVAGGTLPAKMWHDFMIEAVKNVEPSDFSDPAPILTLAERRRREQRGGVDPGTEVKLPELPTEGPYVDALPLPEVTTTTTTTTTPPPDPNAPAPPPTSPPSTTKPAASPSTTTTTRPRSPSTSSTTAPPPRGRASG